MIRSMTGFASVRRRFGDTELAWEIKTVNHRYLEISPRLPRDWNAVEPVLRERVSAKLSRGKVDCNLKFERATDGSASLRVDTAVLAQLGEAMDAVQQEIHGLSQANALDVLNWGGVLASDTDDPESLKVAALEALDEALSQLVDSRLREGASLKVVILSRCDALEAAAADVAEKLPQVREHWRNRLIARIEELDVEVDPARVEQELLFAAQKMDVAEELDRLTMHIQEVRNTLDSDKSIGRRLDFLMQELNRETNTLSSKSVDSAVTQLTVDMKVLIEQMREQVQNIE
ncbi:MAG: YicC family protein [Gammaproteobacteria bacterium]|nr:YicC family protein [Gammaproteobacteria bacterium]